MGTRKAFKIKRIVAAVTFALAAPGAIQLAQAGAGWGDSTLLDGTPVKRPTFYANSPQGVQADVLSATGGTRDTGTALRKFVDHMPDFGVPGAGNPRDPGAAYVSLAAPDQASYPGSDYYELAIVESEIRMHSDLAKPTSLRTYVQIDPVATYANRGTINLSGAPSTAKAPGSTYLGLPFQSQGIPLTYNDNGTIRPVVITLSDPTTHQVILDSNGRPVLAQAYAYDQPTYLGGSIASFQNRPVRLKFYNGLPAGLGGSQSYTVAVSNAILDSTGQATLQPAVINDGAFHRNGDTLIPADDTLQGTGFSPVLDGGTKQMTDSAAVLGPYDPANPMFPLLDPLVPTIPVATSFRFTQNRNLLHLHGGDNAWVSDGHPHQWIAPALDEMDGIDPLTGAPLVDAQGRSLSITGLLGDGVDANGNPYAGYRRGEIAYNVPDMPDPGPGAVTYYWPVNLSGRLMMFHDHATGITRLNPYLGAAGGLYLIDTNELSMVTNALQTANGGTVGPVEAAGTPIVIQDKTFVPKDVAIEDAKWDSTKWGQEGDLWWPHVYETNQDPESADGTNPVGRWDWGAYFWPVFPSLYALPSGVYGDVSTTPEAFMDTPVVNGMAYPTITVDPKTYRWRILSIGNDRILNLGLYVAADKTTTDPQNPLGSVPAMCDGTSGVPVGDCTEVKMVPFVGPNSPLTTTYACPDAATYPTLPAVNSFGTITKYGWTESGVNSNGITLYNKSFPCAGGLLDTGWGQQDNRPGGVPDPDFMGPPMVRIGTEAGLTPFPVSIPSTPMNYEYNKRSTTVLNIQERGVWLGPGVRADVMIDFSQYAGKTLILYNDNPAPAPAGDPRLDYFTGNGDQTGAGGAPNTLPGFGPNMRTVMQIHVNAATPAQPLDVAALTTAQAAVYQATQPLPPVPMAGYASVSTGYATADTPAHIYTGSIYLNRFQPLTFVTPGPIAYTPGPGSTEANTLVGTNTACTSQATCITQLNAIRTALKDCTKNPTGCDDGLLHVGAGTKVNTFLESKAIQELFEADYGRMNATLGVELPFTSALIQTTIPLAYVDPVTETLKAGETQFWKITHNGVDTHPVHLHMLDAQVINRVGWDGTIKAPTDDELGWKETILMHPLEDIVLAVRAKRMDLPFGLPHSIRADSPFTQVNDTRGFTQVDPTTGNPATVANKWEDYLQEYVWHCHILGHEENDFMRPFLLDNMDQLSAAPTGVTATVNGGSVAVSWTDPTPVADTTVYDAVTNPTGTVGNPGGEIGFRVERALANTNAFAPVAPAGVYKGLNSFNVGVNTSGTAGNLTQVLVKNSVNTLANAVNLVDNTASSTPGAFTLNAPVAGFSGTEVTLQWTQAAGDVGGYNILRDGVQVAHVGAGVTIFTDTGLTPTTTYSYVIQAVGAGGTYLYRVQAVTAKGDTVSDTNATATVAAGTVSTAAQSVTTPQAPVILVAPTNLAVQLVNLVSNSTSGDSVELSWTDNSTNESGYQVQQLCTGTVANCPGGAGTFTTIATLPANSTGGTITLNLGNRGNYSYRVAAVDGATVGPFSATADMNLFVRPNAPSNLVGISGAAGAPATVELSWTDNSNNNLTFQIQRCAGSLAFCATGSAANRWTTIVLPIIGANQTTLSDTDVIAGTTYRYRMRSVNLSGQSALVYSPDVVTAQ